MTTRRSWLWGTLNITTDNVNVVIGAVASGSAVEWRRSLSGGRTCALWHPGSHQLLEPSHAQPRSTGIATTCTVRFEAEAQSSIRNSLRSMQARGRRRGEVTSSSAMALEHGRCHLQSRLTILLGPYRADEVGDLNARSMTSPGSMSTRSSMARFDPNRAQRTSYALNDEAWTKSLERVRRVLSICVTYFDRRQRS
jgi:hypothetical protein